MLLLDLASEKQWSEAFEKSQNALATLADAALAEFDAGETKPLSEL